MAALEYTIYVINDCGETRIQVSNVGMKGQLFRYNGGDNYPKSFTVKIEPVIDQSFTFDPMSAPDKLIVEIAGVEVLNTGYRGNTAWQAQLDARLAALSEPIELITAQSGPVVFNFSNVDLAEYVQVKVYGPCDDKNWTIF